MNQIEVLRSVNLDWAMRLSEVWDDLAWDVPDLHASIRQEFDRKLKAMRANRGGGSPLGWVLVGSGGTGKTHLLGSFRREAARSGAAFVLVDMTDVRDFWETVLQGYIDSLQQSFEGGNYQFQTLLHRIIEQLGPSQPVGKVLDILAQRRSTDLRGDIQKVLLALSRSHRNEAQQYHNVVRALICLNSDDFTIANLGMTWLQGLRLEDADRESLGFTVLQEPPRRIVTGLSWLMSLGGPTIVAFDQLDPIVTQLHFRKLGETSSEEQSVAEAIIVQIGSGLGTLRDATRNTLTVVSCVESTWEILSGTVLKTFLDRFEPHRRLEAVGNATIARSIVRNRLTSACATVGFTPAYPSWPFRPEAFEEVKLDTPREVLKKCELHRQQCLRQSEITELTSFRLQPAVEKRSNGEIRSQFLELDRRLTQLAAESNPDRFAEEKEEDQKLAPLLQTALQCLLHENPLPPEIDGLVDSEFTGGTTTRPLHARLRLIFTKENEREEHFCVRALEQTNARAYQARLKAAMTQAGIDRSLKFRHLCLVRTHPLPGGAETQKLTQKFIDSGGTFLKPSPDELRTIIAVHLLKQSGDPDFQDWLRFRRPISRLSLIQGVVPSDHFFGPENGPPTPTGPDERRESHGEATPPVSSTPDGSSSPGEESSSVLSRQTPFPLGRALIGGRAGAAVTMPVGLLEKHTLVLAGAGSGKTVLLRRLIEEGVLAGVPSIVIDCANDLATLDEQWPRPPETWLPEDAAKAKRYHESSEVVVWTPGREGGNPLALEPLPDWTAFRQDDDELEAVVAMALESLAPVAAFGNSATSRNKMGILSRALRFLARNGGGTLDNFVSLLADLPPQAGLGVANENKLARQMADALRVAVETNPLLRSTGASLDPAVLFGAAPPARTRVSVISFASLSGLEAQRAFLNQLAMTLFSWLKRHPDPGQRPLRGLLVIDEAKDFVPSGRSSTCKESLTRLTAQARKYHLGLIFATQNPKDIDNKIVANCSTHYYGKLNSPAAIEVAQDLIRQKGGSGEDVPRLPRGQFYVYNADAQLVSPTKVYSPLCLSRHPEHPLDEAAVVKKAAASRLVIGRPEPEPSGRP